MKTATDMFFTISILEVRNSFMKNLLQKSGVQAAIALHSIYLFIYYV